MRYLVGADLASAQQLLGGATSPPMKLQAFDMLVTHKEQTDTFLAGSSPGHVRRRRECGNYVMEITQFSGKLLNENRQQNQVRIG